jgi:Spy/CpxP family protein refolding chaperone
MRWLTGVLALAVSLLVVSQVMAQERPPRGPRGPRPMMMIDRIERMEALNLTADQKTKLETLKKELGPKAKEAAEKMEGVLTAEQKKARGEAIAEARKARKSPEETRKAAQDAVKLTDEQKKAQGEARKAFDALQKNMREKVMAVLTAEQKETLRKAMAERRGGRGGDRPEGGNPPPAEER